MRRLVLMASLVAPSTAFADWPLGSKLTDGVLVDVTEDGFGLVENLASTFIPPQIAVPPSGAADSNGCLFGACLYAYDIQVSNLFVDIGIDNMAITPGNGVLTLDADATITVNSPASPADLYVFAELIYIEIFDETCQLWVDPIHLSMNGDIELDLLPDPQGVDLDGDGTPDTKVLDVTVPPMSWSWDADGSDINFGNCGLADTIDGVNEVTSFFGLDLYDLLLDFVEPTIDDLVNDLPAEIEPLLEDTFAELTISEPLDLMGVPLELTLWPETLVINNDGLRIGMGTVVDVPEAACVEKYAIDASIATSGAPPAVGQAPGLPFTEHMGALLDDDWVNHLLFAVWSGGLLCFDLPSPDLELPLPIDTTLLGILAPGVYDGLFPEVAPMVLRTDPKVPPTVDPAGPHDIDVVAEDLGLGFYAELDGRQARIVNIDLDANVGVDLAFDGTTGNLGIVVDMGEGAIVPSVTFNEFVPDKSDQIAASFGGLFDVLVGPLLGDLLAGTTFPIPSFEGVGVLDLEAQSAGANGDFVGAFVEAGVVPYYSVGCDTSKGCDTSSCSSGCSTGGIPGLALFGLPLVVFAGLRRRR